jgi:class 3 adenylate cyclase
MQHSRTSKHLWVAVLFSDIQGYSNLTPEEELTFTTAILPLLAEQIEPVRNKLIEIKTWGDGMFATSLTIAPIADLAIAVRNFFRNPPAPHTNLIIDKIKVRIALDFVPAYETRNFIEGSSHKGAFGAKLARAARLEPITAPNAIFVTKDFHDNFRGDPQFNHYKFDLIPEELYLPKGYGPIQAYSMHLDDTPPAQWESESKRLQAIAPISVESWDSNKLLDRHKGIKGRFDECSPGDEVCFIAITGKSVIYPDVPPGQNICDTSVVARSINRGIKVRGIVLDPQSEEADFRSWLETPQEDNPLKRMLQKHAEIVEGIPKHPDWSSLKHAIQKNFLLKKTGYGLSFSLWVFPKEAIIEPYHFGKHPDRPHMCEFSQVIIRKVRFEYEALRVHFENLWEMSDYVWPSLHGARVPELQDSLLPKALHDSYAQMTRNPSGQVDWPQLCITHVFPETLAEFSLRLRDGLHAIKRCMSVYCGTAQQNTFGICGKLCVKGIQHVEHFTLLQVHGREGEQRLLETLLSVQPIFEPHDLQCVGRFTKNLMDPKEQFAHALLQNFSGMTKAHIAKFISSQGGTIPIINALRDALIQELNKIVNGPLFYSENLFRGVELRPYTKRLLEASRKNSLSGDKVKELNRMLLEDAIPLISPIERRRRTIVYIHRPEELILRLAQEGGISYRGAKGKLRRLLRGVGAVVLPGHSYVKEYQSIVPTVPVLAIPLGFNRTYGKTNEIPDLDDTITFIGSDTSWGEMRHADDVSHLVKAINSLDHSLAICGYVLGTADHHCKLDQLANHPDYMCLSNAEVLSAYREGAFKSRQEFRRWLAEKGKGKVILRASRDGATCKLERPVETEPELLAWERGLIDFDVQLYHEVLNASRDKERQGQPKVEYSGTLHRTRPQTLFVVFESPAMDDVRTQEGIYMVEVPTTKGNTQFYEAAVKIIELIRNPELRRAKLKQNADAAALVGMPEVAYGFCTLMRRLSEQMRSRPGMDATLAGLS